jgi:hypothetical protein
MSWGEEFVAAFERVRDPLGGLRAAASPSPDLSPAELALCYVQVVLPGETAAQAATRLKGSLEVAAKEADRVFTTLIAVEQAIVAAQIRIPPATIEEAGGMLLSSDFKARMVVNHPQYGSRILTLGGVNSLPPGHWCRGVLGDDDWFNSGDGPCIFIGDGQLISIREAVDVTKRLRRIQRDTELAYRQEQEQAEQRARLQWEQSQEGQMHALRQEIKELQQRVAAGA